MCGVTNLIEKKNTNYIVILSYLAGLLKLSFKPRRRSHRKISTELQSIKESESNFQSYTTQIFPPSHVFLTSCRFFGVIVVLLIVYLLIGLLFWHGHTGFINHKEQPRSKRDSKPPDYPGLLDELNPASFFSTWMELARVPSTWLTARSVYMPCTLFFFF